MTHLQDGITVSYSHMYTHTHSPVTLEQQSMLITVWIVSVTCYFKNVPLPKRLWNNQWVMALGMDCGHAGGEMLLSPLSLSSILSPTKASSWCSRGKCRKSRNRQIGDNLSPNMLSTHVFDCQTMHILCFLTKYTTHFSIYFPERIDTLTRTLMFNPKTTFFGGVGGMGTRHTCHQQLFATLLDFMKDTSNNKIC